MGSLHHDRLAAIIINASAQGAERKSATLWEWDVSGNCSAPKPVELYGRPSADHRNRLRNIVVKRGTKTSLRLILHTRCRKCRNCLRQKKRMWLARAMHEIRAAERTWWCTFTLRPMEHYNMQARGLLHAESRSIPMKELSAADASRLQSNEVAKELTKFFKRVRKQAGSRSLRYLLIRENHKSGLPHYHAFIHEVGDVPIRHAVLTQNWRLGFSKFKLLSNSEQAAAYATKYLNKADEGRVRASIRYGRIASDPATASAIDTQSVV